MWARQTVLRLPKPCLAVAVANLWTIAPTLPFADTLVKGYLARFGRDPLTLAEGLILLPNRRAVRTVQTAFLQAVDAQATLLPRLAVLGDDPEDGVGSLGMADLAPTIEPMARLGLLARLIEGWQAHMEPKPAQTPAQVARLAASLARFLDQSITEGLDFAKLDDLVPEEFAVHWQHVLSFLKIVTEQWPGLLSSLNRVDESLARRNRLEALRQRWLHAPPQTPVVAAGSTGSIPATAALMDVVRTLPDGHVVLPPVDCDAPDEMWDVLSETHPFGPLKRLLERFDAHRAEVLPWQQEDAPEPIASRVGAVSAALAPSATFQAGLKDQDPGQTLCLIEAEEDHQEATAAALLLRQVLETPGRTGALITPDRALARRVAARLARWDIHVDDSGGQPLADTPPARFVLLLADFLAAPDAPVPLLALLKHPYFRFGRSRAEVLEVARLLDQYHLRGVRRSGGVSSLIKRLDDNSSKTLLSALERLTESWPTEAKPAAQFIAQLMEWADTLSDETLFAGEDGMALALWADGAATASPGFDATPPASLGALMEALMTGQVVRSGRPGHPRLAILGTIEARMQRPDVAVLAGLNEGVWPPAAPTDPWMNEPMRQAFGLPPHDRRIGLSALDFLQGCSAEQVFLTRTTKKDGAETLPSRWVARLKAAYGPKLRRGYEVLAWTQALDAPPAYKPWPQPKPTPPLSARPRDLSVSDIERWLRDPYALYAKHVLKLKPLEDIDQAPGAADKGSTIHTALERFFKAHPGALPEDPKAALMEAGKASFSKWRGQPGIYALWWPRYGDLVDWLVSEQTKLFEAGRRVAGAEVEGKLILQVGDYAWTVRATADRIDAAAGLTILDYKTGAVPAARAVKQGYAPQLSVEGLMAQAGAFPIAAQPVDALEYWALSTTGQAPPKRVALADPKSLIEDAQAGLEALFSAFGIEKTPYLHAPSPMHAPYRDYDDLARPEEWRDIPEAAS